MGLGDRLRRLDANPVSGGVAWLATYVTAPIAAVGGVVLIVIGMVELVMGGDDSGGLLVMGAAWLGLGLFLLPRAFWRWLRQRR
jgi:hypothetical protein